MSKSKKPGETAEEKELAKIAGERWERYKQKFIPIENVGISRTMENLRGPSGFNLGQANIGTQAGFSGAERELATGLTLQGRGPGSESFVGRIAGLNMDRAASSGLGQANIAGFQQTQGITNLQRLINLGQGQATEGLSGLSDAAAVAQQQAFLDARASAASRNALGTAIGTGAGMAYGQFSGGGAGTSKGFSSSFSQNQQLGNRLNQGYFNNDTSLLIGR